MSDALSRLLARLVALLPWGALRGFGSALGWFVGDVLRVRRAHVESAMRRAGIAEAEQRAAAMYASLGTALFEFLWMVGRPDTGLAGKVEISPEAARVIAAHGAGGLVIATAHTGNWDLVGCAAAGALLPGLTIETKRLRVGWLDRFWQRTRGERGVAIVSGAGAFARLHAVVAEGRSVAMLIDQAPERASAVIELPFLGATARCDAMPAMLAARAGVPVALALGHRRADGTHLVDIPLVVVPPAHASRHWIRETTAQLNKTLEAFVRAHPEQWLWLHRRWKGRAPSSRGRSAAGLGSLVSQAVER